MQLDPFSYISGCGDLSSDDEYRDANVCRDINIYESDKKQKEKCGKKGRWVQDDDKNVQVCKWTKEVGCKKSKGFSCGDDNEGNETDETDFETETETDDSDDDICEGMTKKQIKKKIDELESERKNASRERQKEIKKQLKTCRALKGGGDSDNEGNETDETDETDFETETETDDSDDDICEGMTRKQINGKIEELKAEKKAAKGERKGKIKRQLATCRDRKIGGGDNDGNTQKEKPNNNSNLKDNTMDSGDSGVNMNLGDNMTGDINIALPDTKKADEDDNVFFLEVLEAQNDQVENINDITKLVKEKANSRKL